MWATTANPFKPIEFTFKDCRVPYRDLITPDTDTDDPFIGQASSSLEFVAKTRKVERLSFRFKRNDNKLKSLSAKRKGHKT